MSGEVVLVDGGDGAITRLVSVASELLTRIGTTRAALVGGLAVTIRLATVHRATNDVDTVADGDAPLEYIGENADDAGRVEIDGVKVDVMTTAPLPSHAAELPDGELDRLFVLGHRWALESAEAVGVRVAMPPDGVGDVRRLVIATAPALVACKFHAISDRRGARREKRESDAVDLMRLIDDLVRAPSSGFAAAPFDLAALVSHQTQRWFIDDAARVARLVNLNGSDRVEPADVATFGELFLEQLGTS